MKKQSTVNAYIHQAVVDYWNSEALTNLHAETYTYKDIARKITKIHIMFEAGDLKPGDKVALCGGNSAEWIMAFLAVISYGAVAVPILNEFTSDTLHHLINHSDAKVLFVDSNIWKRLEADAMPELIATVCVEDYSLLLCRDEKVMDARQRLNELFGRRYPERFTPEDVKFAEVGPESTVLINYTAGSTGFSKGVMISEHALWSNLQYCFDHLDDLKAGDNMLSLLPLAHMYGLVIEMLHPLLKGCHVYLLNRTPSPKILIDAFSIVKPKLIISVPLVLEKIIKTRVFPKMRKPFMKILLHIPGIRGRILAKVRQSLIDAFGGNLIEMIIGGAALDKTVEAFLHEINFPITVGYGMTECAPLISYCPHATYKAGSCGKVVERMNVRIDSPDPTTRPGILWVKGENVMQGYYKNEEATQSVIKNGWMSTGDICQIDTEGNIFIRGRDKNMILGPSGQNIYPEEIEAVINDNPLVVESVVIDNNGRIEALIYPDFELVNDRGLNEEAALQAALRELITDANKKLPNYSQIADVHIQPTEFEKTPKRSIKRYLYQPNQ